MNIIGMQSVKVRNLDNQAVLLPQVLRAHILIMDIIMNNSGINHLIPINGEENKLDKVLGNLVSMNTIGMQAVKVMLGD